MDFSHIRRWRWSWPFDITAVVCSVIYRLFVRIIKNHLSNLRRVAVVPCCRVEHAPVPQDHISLVTKELKGFIGSGSMCAPARTASARAGESLVRSLGNTQYIPRNSLPPQTGQPRSRLPRGSGSAAEELTSGVTTSPLPLRLLGHGPGVTARR